MELRIDEHTEYLNSIKDKTANTKNRPNFIVIAMDDMGWGDISCYGSTAINTPNIDRLATEGTAFHNGYASSPVCSPSRFSILTGRYPSRNMIKNVYFPSTKAKKSDLIDKKYDQDGILSKAKEAPSYHKFYPLLRRMYLNGVSGILPDEVTIPEALKITGYKTAMFGKWHLGDRSPSLPNDKGFDHFLGAHYSNDMVPYNIYNNREIKYNSPVDQTQLTERFTSGIEDYIEDNSDNPFFIYYASPWPHHPLHPGKDFKGKSKAGDYGDCLEEVDAGIGRILDKLKDKGVDKNTMIIFTSDNGPWHQGSPGLHRGRKGNSFDGGHKVPMIMHWPDKIPAGKKITESMMNIDFLPTILNQAGIELPTDRVIDGKDIMPLLTGEEEKSPHDALFYIDNDHGIRAKAVQTRDHFKYYPSTNSDNAKYKAMMIHPFLFDLNSDQNESYDVRSLHPDKSQELQDRLKKFNKEIIANPRGFLVK